MSVTTVSLSVSYDGVRPVVDRVDLEVATNEWLGLLGPNGAGKTSLLKAIAGLVPSQGTVSLDGSDPKELGRNGVARRVAYLPQEPVMPGGMTVSEYVLLGRTPHLPYLGSEGANDLSEAASALEMMELMEFADRPLEDLSGGERQRVVLARALAQQPSIMLLDEPTSALDIGHRQAALEQIGAIRNERAITIISAMHDLTLAGQFADRLVMLSAGKIVAEGSASTVLTVETIARYYHATVKVIALDGGEVAVVPARMSS
jgi:iron complex transport system ATP-binding protein